jgi:hypothetical protein
LVAGLRRDDQGRLDVVFDFSAAAAGHSGTTELGKHILRQAGSRWTSCNVHVVAPADVVRFHGLDTLEGVRTIPMDSPRPFAAAVRMGQPFAYGELDRMSRLAAVNIYAMLDPIAYDCLHLNTPDLDEIWNLVFTCADGVIYISEFVRELFRARFAPRADLRELVTYLSLDFRDYVNRPPTPAPDSGHILVIGNRHFHKRLPETVDLLSEAFGHEQIVALGLSSTTHRNVVTHESGAMDDESVDRLYEGARVVVFPSMYEGFGFPIMRGLANQRPVLARRTAVADAIQERTGESENLVLYETSEDLIRRLRDGFPTWRNGGLTHRGDPNHGWVHVGDQIGTLLSEAVNTFSLSNLEHRLRSIRLHTRVAATAARLEQQLADTRHEVRALRTSHSWRMTAPLREAARIIRGVRRRR